MAHVNPVLFGKELTKTDVNVRRNSFKLTEEDFLAFKNVLIPRDRELFDLPSYQYPFVVEDFPFSSMLWSLNCKKSETSVEAGRFAGGWGKFVEERSLKKGSWLFFVWNQELYRMRVNVVSPQEELNAEEQILFDALDDIIEDSVVGHTRGTTDPGGAGLEGTADPEGTTGTGGTAVGVQRQALFSFALRSGKFMLKDGPDNKEVLDKIIAKIKGLCHHTWTYYWLGLTQLNNVYRYKTEEYSHTALNKFNVSPESIPDWLFEFMPLRGGYFIGNVSPACMDFRWFLLGNCIAILSSLLTPQQASEIMDLIVERWDEIIEEMPLKITYPALESDEWKTITGYESKNTWWSYHNGGFWPALLWLLGAACFKTRRPQMARNAIDLVEKRLCKDGWSEYDSFFASAILAGVGGSKSMAVDRFSDSTAHSKKRFFLLDEDH